MKYKSIIILFVSIIVFSLTGLLYDTQYRSLTRILISEFSNYDLRYYGAKEIRFLVPDLGFIIALIPTGLYIISKSQKEKKKNLFSILTFSGLLILFYLFYCFLESQIIKYTTPVNIKNVYYFHHQNVNYQLIALFSIISSQILNYFILLKYLKPKLNKQKNLYETTF